MSQRVCLSCEVNDTRAEVKWYKDAKLLTSSKTVRAESKGKTRQLVIDSVEAKDGGEYMCEVGGDKLLFKIHVEGKKKKKVACSSAFDTFTVFSLRVDWPHVLHFLGDSTALLGAFCQV